MFYFFIITHFRNLDKDQPNYFNVLWEEMKRTKKEKYNQAKAHRVKPGRKGLNSKSLDRY